MRESIEGHVVAGVAIVAAATVALCLGHLSEAAYLGVLGAGVAPAALKGLRA
jgi:hypothetical protein